MAQQVQHVRDGHARRAPRLTALVALLLATGTAAGLLAVRGAHVVQSLPTARVEVHLELLVLAVGVALAARVAVTSALALACVAAQGVGRRWDAGERLVLRLAPAAVLRLAGIGVSLSVGAGLALGAGAAQAAELPPAPEQGQHGSVLVDLGWQPTAQPDDAMGDEARPAAPTPPVGTSASDPAAPPAPASGLQDSANDTPGPSAPTRLPDDGASSVPAPVPAGGASWADAPTSDHSVAPAPQAPAQSRTSPATPGGPPAGWPDGPTHGTPQPPHVPLSTLLGASGRAATPSPGTSPDPTAPAPSVVEIVVLRGDTLWSLAERSLGAEASDAQVAAECRRWFDANQDVIGDDPDLIKPGQILSAPRSP